MRTEILTDFPERFTSLETAALCTADGRCFVTSVESARFHKGRVLLKMKGIDTIDDVERWRNAEVRVRRSDAVPLPADTYYVTDLIGMTVLTEDGVEIGVVDDVVANPGHDLLKVGDDLIPMVKAIVRSVDVANRRITVDPPLGLLQRDGELRVEVA